MTNQIALRRSPLEQIEDPNLRDSLQWIVDYLLTLDLLGSNFKFFELTFTKAETALAVPHKLGFQPIDILQTSLTGAGVPTFVYNSFTDKNFVITTTGACVVRFFAGRYDV